MNINERILIFIYFPQFKSPNSSRFESLFASILKKKSHIHTDKNKSKIICPKKIVRNEDKRTSIIIKGIPKSMPKQEVRSFFEQYGNLNYLFIIKDPNDLQEKTSIAYVNVINYKSILPLYMNLRNYKFKIDEQLFNVKIIYSAAQGKKQLKQYVKKINSCKFSSKLIKNKNVNKDIDF